MRYLIFVYEAKFKINSMKEERTLKISIETAREWYELAKECEIHGKTNPAIKFLEENFTKEELEKNKGYTWEESVGVSGFFITGTSNISELLLSNSPNNTAKQFFKTEKQALSALAFAQLTYITAKYNEGKTNLKSRRFCISKTQNSELIIHEYPFEALPLYFIDYMDAGISIKVNEELWKQYWMIE